MTTTSIPATDSERFFWDATANEYQGEISETNGLTRDGEMALVKGSTRMTFKVAKTISDADGDVQYWILAATGLTPRWISVRLFND